MPHAAAPSSSSHASGPVVIKKVLDHLKSKGEACEPFPSPVCRAPHMGLFD